MALATGISDRTIRTGIKELDDPEAAPSNRQRQLGAGRRTREVEQPRLAPPGTSKWNKIEHRLFCHITRNRQGVPLETREIVVQLIGATKTDKGLEVHAWLDEATYESLAKCPIRTWRLCESNATSFTANEIMKSFPVN